MSEEFTLTMDDLLALEVDWRIGGIADPIGQIYNSVVVTLESAFSAAVGSFQSIVSSVVNSAISGISGVISSMASNLQYVIGSIQSLPGLISSGLSGIISSISSILYGVASSISSTISQISSVVSSGFSSVLSSLNSAFNSLSSSVNSTIRSIATQITSSFNTVVSSLQTAFAQVGSSLSSIGAQITAGLNSAFSQVVSSINSIVSQINSFAGTISTAINSALSSVANSLNAVGAQIISGINTAFSSFTTQLNALVTAITAPISSAVHSALNAFFSSSEFKNLFAFPKALTDFMTSATSFLNQLTARHSPSILDNVGSFFEILVTLFSSTGALGAFFQSEAWKGIIGGKGLATTLKTDTNFFKPLTDFLNDIGANILPTLQTFIGDVQGGLFDLGNYMVDGLISLTGLPMPSGSELVSITDFNGKQHIDPFHKFFSSITDDLQLQAAKLSSKSPITQDQVLGAIAAIGTGVAAAETAEYLGLTIDLAHPMKAMGFQKKFHQFFRRMGWERLSGLLVVALTATTFSPILRRYFNSIARQTLPNPDSILTMQDRLAVKPDDATKYLSEHGYSDSFITGLRENHFAIPQPANAADSYFRAVAFEGFSADQALKEISGYFDFYAFKSDKRQGYSFSDKDLVTKLLYRLPNFRQMRVLLATGQASKADFTKLLIADRMKTEYVDKIANAMVLQGQLPYLKAQESAFMSQVQHGFETGVTFTDMLKKIGYPQAFIDPTVAAAEIKADEELNILQVSEFDKHYTEGYMTRDDYVKNVEPLFKNKDIYAAHLEIADLAVQRMTDNRIRTASDRSISEELTAFANGAVSAAEFETICKAGNKTADEIKALESARQIIYKNLVRTVKFRNYQGALGKGNIKPAQFKELSLKLPIDSVIVDATMQHIILGMVKAAKITPAAANDLLAQAGIPLVTG